MRIPSVTPYGLPAGAIAGALLLYGCVSYGPSPPLPPPGNVLLSQLESEGSGMEGGVGVRIRVDTAMSAVVALAGPFHVPAMGMPMEGGPAHQRPAMATDDEHPIFPMVFDWPVDGWLRGFEFALFDPQGRPMDESMVHHFVVINFDRRQLIYETPERLLAFGRETGDVELPNSFGVPMTPGQRMGMYAAWHNESDTAAEVYLRLVMRWTPADKKPRPTDVLPVFMDVSHVPGGSSGYDLPPGRSERSYEFEVPIDGRLLAVSGHMHDYGLSVRLEEAETGRDVVAVSTRLDGNGKIINIDQKTRLGLFGRGIRLHAGRRYRLVGKYDNPEPDTLRAGAMAQLVAVFAPDDWAAWPVVDPAHPNYRQDVAGWEWAGVGRRDGAGRRDCNACAP